VLTGGSQPFADATLTALKSRPTPTAVKTTQR
jgi:hypothetical protein